MSKALVAYFSATGITKEVAQNLAKIAQADEFEIIPKEPYTSGDIKWINPLARCNKEKFGNKDVPVQGKVENMDEYDIIYLGFPIWYYGAPNVINTFVKGYDLSGKKIALFATSGGSDISKSGEKLKPYLSDTAQIVGAKLFKKNDGEDVMKDWIDSIQ